MRRIPLILSSILFFFVCSALVMFNACNSDTCETLVCKNNGVCRDGRCRCAAGFEGVNCETKMYEKFVGTFDGQYRCNGLPDESIINIISPGSTPNTITIHDIFEIGLLTNATIDLEHSDEIKLDPQTVGDFIYEGQGHINGRYLTIFVQQYNKVDSTYNSCIYNGIKYIKP